ncbi:ABC transporter ATP-binding protein [Dactylosporangium sp. NBC_01737]|uniref:ABC transporter ATP-binding protein n=1 Tax=Dactylosporangium sp. NBC_01737 TaxID=2975959 RepID=UPI002E0E6AD1|nr:ABC transporter ATP-binding protein [Dactylosporangium sp. NBC_01737]
MSVIDVSRLGRTFRSRSGLRRTEKVVEAVRGISFQVERGELFGLLGPNGAGKTTTIKMLITLLLPTSGRIEVLGHDVVARPREVRRRVGYVFGGDRGLYERLSGLDNLRYFAELYAVPAREQRARIGELLELVGLTGREHERVEGYSRGMRQRLHIARGLLHRPEILFLDEPSIGIDPVGARELRQTVKALIEQGTTVLLTTHYMFEADELCDRIAVLAGGRIVAEGTPEQLKQKVSVGNVLEVEVFGLPGGVDQRIRALPGVRSLAVEERGPAQVLLVHTEPGSELTQSVLGTLDGTQVGRVATRQPTLEDAYVELVGGA